MPVSSGEVLGESLLLLFALLPLGLVLARLGERLLGHPFRLEVPERALVAFYAAGTVFFVIASIPVPIYGTASIFATLGVGIAGYLVWVARERGRSLRTAVGYVLSPPGLALSAGSFGLLVFELFPIWNHPFPNAYDGSVTALWMNLTLRNGTLPSTLAPFASAPVVYPLATTVWMTLPVRVFGWPLVQAPVLLPSLFLSFTVVAAYSWGSRWATSRPTPDAKAGLLFAAFFGLVASWPRFYTGGSYDFAFALPLFLLALGLTPALVRAVPRPPVGFVAFGILAGVLASISLAAGEALVILLLAFGLVEYRNDLHRIVHWLGGVAIVIGFELLFALRSVVAWLAYPGPAYTASSTYGPLDVRLVEGELDPLVPWKYKISPFAGLSLELQVLLVLGIALAAWASWDSRGGRVTPDLRKLASRLILGAITLLLLTSVLLIVALPGAIPRELRNITNLDQTSVILFIFFEGLCLFPLVLALRALRDRRGTSPPGLDPGTAGTREDERGYLRTSNRSGVRRAVEIGAVLVLVVPLLTGAVYSVAEGPSFIAENVGKTSNVTPGDVAVMEWAGNHLPACSSVLVAPGSAGQFLPEYAEVRLLFPMNPVPQSPPYLIAVANLTSGVFSAVTSEALESLDVTEVLVTGATSVGYLPFSATPLSTSPEFSLLTSSGDASLFEFLPGGPSSGCGA